MKQCTKCNMEKELCEFYAHKRGKDGLLAYCKVCTRAHVKAYAVTNREKVRDSNRKAGAKFRSANLIAERERTAQYRKLNPEVCRQRVESWRKANLDTKAANEGERRAAKLLATTPFANQGYINLFYKLARLESERLGVTVHVDHIVPLKSSLVCGLHTEHNLQLLVASDNLKKSNRVWPDMP